MFKHFPLHPSVHPIPDVGTTAFGNPLRWVMNFVGLLWNQANSGTNVDSLSSVLSSPKLVYHASLVPIPLPSRPSPRTSDTNHLEKPVQSKREILQQYGFPRNYPVFAERNELVELLRGTMAPELCRATAKLAKECFEDVSENVVGGEQVVESNTSSPRKRKDPGSQASPTKKVRWS